MLFLDVNICLYGFRPLSEKTEAVADWLDNALTGPRTVAVSEQVLSSVIRIATSHRFFDDASDPDSALAFTEALLNAPSARVVRPGPSHWRIFTDLVREHRLRGNDVPDAYLAALALEHRATFVTRDRGFARFKGLRTLDPLAEA